MYKKILFAIVLAIIGFARSAAREAYAVLSSDEKTLTFYCDDLRATHTEVTYDLNIGNNSPYWTMQSEVIEHVVFDQSFGYAMPTTTSFWFANFSRLTSIEGLNFLNTSNVTSMKAMFYGCSALQTLDVSGFITSYVSDASSMFFSCQSLRMLNLTSFELYRATDLSYMFAGCSQLKTIYVSPEWTIHPNANTSYMFDYCSNNLVGGLGTVWSSSHVDGEYARIDSGTANPGYLTMAQSYAVLQNGVLSFYFDSSRAVRSGTKYNLNLRGSSPAWESMGGEVQRVVFDPSFADARPTATYHWFLGFSNLTEIEGIEYLNTSCVTTMSGMFYGCSALETIDVSNFDTRAVTDMIDMFNACTALQTLDLSSFDTRNVINMQQMFYGCVNLQTIIVGEGWNMSRASNSSNLFYGCTSLVGSAGTAYDPSHVDGAYAHVDGGPANPGYFSIPLDYVALSADGKTLTFYCDDQRATRGTTFSIPQDGTNPGWFSITSYTKVVFDPSFAAARPKSTYRWFYAKIDISEIQGLEYLNTERVTDMREMFAGCTSLTALDLSTFDTRRVTTMAGMFTSCTGLTSLDLSSFNTAGVTDMSLMFFGCNELSTLELSSFDTHAVTNVSSMFAWCEALTTILVSDGWDMGRVTSSADMFAHCTNKLVGCRGTVWSSSHVGVDYAHVDGGTANPGYLSRVGSYVVVSEDGKTLTFYHDDLMGKRSGTPYEIDPSHDPLWGEYNSNLQSIVFDPSFAEARPTSTRKWFENASNVLRITGIEYLNTSEVTDMYAMFMSCYKLQDIDLSGFNTSKVTIMDSMFEGCGGNLKSLDLSSFDTHNVEDMRYMFYACENLYTIVVGPGWDVSGVTSAYSSNMFTNCFKLVGGERTSYSSYHVDAAYAHVDGGTANPGYLSQVESYAFLYRDILHFRHDGGKGALISDCILFRLNTGSDIPEWNDYSDRVVEVEFARSFAQARPTSTYHWFYGMSNLVGLSSITYLNTSQVTTMAGMFANCTSLPWISLTDFDTENVEDMSYMFSGCPELIELDLTSFNTENVQTFAHMFSGCSSLKNLNLSTLSLAKATNVESMFNGCTNLETICNGDDWSTQTTITHSSSMFADCPTLVGGAGTTYTQNHVGLDYARVDGGTASPGYFSAPKPYVVLSSDSTRITFYYDAFSASHVSPEVTYDIKAGLVPWNAVKSRIKSVNFNSSFANYTPTSTGNWFGDMPELTSIYNLQYLNTNEVTDMQSMFSGCQKLTSLDLSKFNTEKVTDMGFMFYNCTALTSLDVSSFNTSNVRNMARMFCYCSALTTLDVSGFNTANVKNMGNMFNSCTNLTALDVSGFNTANSTTMNGMFYGCANLTELDVSGFNTANVTSMSYMFYNCAKLTALDVSGFNTANVVGMNGMFNNCAKLTALDVSGFNTANVTSMSTMFYSCSALTALDVSGFDTKKVVDMTHMFHGCSALTTLDLSSFNTEKVISMEMMFNSCKALKSIVFDKTRFVTSSVKNMSNMFSSCNQLESLDVSFFDTQNVTTMNSMFSLCSSLPVIDVCGFNTDKLTNTNYMFTLCSALTQLDLSNFNTANVTSMTAMFRGCSNLTTISVGDGWTTDALPSNDFGPNMFDGCSSLVGGAGTTYDGNHIDAAYAHVDGGTSGHPGYFTAAPEPEPYAVLSEDSTTLTFYYDRLRIRREGTTYSLPWTSTYPEWTTNVEAEALKSKILTVDFDPSFANYHGLTKTSFMFYNLRNLTQINHLDRLNTENVTLMNRMFGYCSKIQSLDVSHFNTENVTSMGNMFLSCSNLTSLDLSSFNTEKVISFEDMFLYDRSLKSVDISSFNTSNALSLQLMFGNCSALEALDITHFNTSKATQIYGMFKGCSSLTALDVSHLDVSHSSDLSNLFDGCSSLTNIDVSNFNTVGAANMASMFMGCSSLTSIDVSNFNTSNVLYFGNMFRNCDGLQSIDVSNFDVSKATSMVNMFYDCNGLTTIVCNDDWQKDGVSSTNMFYGSTNLVGGAGTTYDAEHIDAAYAHVDDATSGNPGYFTAKSTYSVGDVNKDGKITIADVTALVNIILGKTTTYDERLADVNDDKKVTIADVTALVNIILGK